MELTWNDVADRARRYGEWTARPRSLRDAQVVELVGRFQLTTAEQIRRALRWARVETPLGSHPYESRLDGSWGGVDRHVHDQPRRGCARLRRVVGDIADGDAVACRDAQRGAGQRLLVGIGGASHVRGVRLALGESGLAVVDGELR